MNNKGREEGALVSLPSSLWEVAFVEENIPCFHEIVVSSSNLRRDRFSHSNQRGGKRKAQSTKHSGSSSDFEFIAVVSSVEKKDHAAHLKVIFPGRVFTSSTNQTQLKREDEGMILGLSTAATSFLLFYLQFG